jgi:hypothetical protein
MSKTRLSLVSDVEYQLSGFRCQRSEIRGSHRSNFQSETRHLTPENLKTETCILESTNSSLISETKTATGSATASPDRTPAWQRRQSVFLAPRHFLSKIGRAVYWTLVQYPERGDSASRGSENESVEENFFRHSTLITRH